MDIEKHTNGFLPLKTALLDVPVDRFCQIAGLDTVLVRQVARDFAQAESACVRTDLGIEQSHNSTLNSYLSRLLFLITGNFARKVWISSNQCFK